MTVTLLALCDLVIIFLYRKIEFINTIIIEFQIMKHSSKETSINRLYKLNYVMIDDNLYKNTNTRMDIKCLTHDITWESTVGEAYRQAKCCDLCKQELGDWSEVARKNNYTILNVDGINATFQCEFMHDPWTTQKQHIKFTKCKECSGKILSKKTVVDKINSLGFTLLNEDEFETTKSKGNFKCVRNHEWFTEIHNVYFEKSSCPICSTGKNETRCRFILDTIFQKRFYKTRSVIEGGLELDMYNDELNLGLEYQGIQHFIEDKLFFHKYGGFEEQLERDSRKKKYCEDNGINLILVSYKYYTFNSIVEYIILRLKELNICPDNIDSIDWDQKQLEFNSDSEYTNTNNNGMAFNGGSESEWNKLAKEKQATYLGYCRNAKTDRPEIKFLCKNNHEFSHQSSDFKRGRWCPKCSTNSSNNTDSIADRLKNIDLTLTTTYVNNYTPIGIKCDNCDSEYEATWDNLKKREVETYKCCRTCNSSNTKVNEINEKLEKIGFKFADKLYVDAKTKHSYECEKGHKIIANWNAIKVRAGKCKECNPSKNMIKQAKKAATTSKD